MSKNEVLIRFSVGDLKGLEVPRSDSRLDSALVCAPDRERGSVIDDHHELLARIGREYYLENQSKVDIARGHGLSRFQVARYLDEARAEGIVNIEVRAPRQAARIDPEQLASSLGVRRTVVVRTLSGAATRPSAEAEQRDLLARAVAQELMTSARPGMTLGVSWSRTLDLAARHITALPPCEVVQLAGALPQAGAAGQLGLVQSLGRYTGGPVWPLWAPLVVESAEIAAGLRRQPEISDALDKAASLDIAAVAIGAWGPALSTVWERVDNPVRQQALDAGAVAETSGRLIDAQGDPVRGELDERVLAVELEQLARTPEVLAVAQGEARAAAVLAAIAAGVVNTLIIDEALAVELLRKKELRGEGQG
ncbi:sugar-binding transcriptional regulator [Acaricomes phytoseiuli]|uniref:sugar-binding transcriptional regulator n=1 Tax=Acaricomes phytoseiuli TaxID=291968 RepID=UPI0003740EB9|nr:sugar-binding domain-containing protein [Acaricomes phytoseiuli]